MFGFIATKTFSGFEYLDEEEVDVFMNGPPGANRNIQI